MLLARASNGSSQPRRPETSWHAPIPTHLYRTKRRFVEGNLELALSEEPRAAPPRELSGKEEALLVATACSSPPQGRARWTLELLAGEMVRLTNHSGL